jgi:hypothetical protein
VPALPGTQSRERATRNVLGPRPTFVRRGERNEPWGYISFRAPSEPANQAGSRGSLRPPGRLELRRAELKIPGAAAQPPSLTATSARRLASERAARHKRTPHPHSDGYLSHARSPWALWLAAEGDVCGDERAAIGRVLDP